VNPRPSKAELEALLARISFPKRVVQVWFQNMRARDRRKARISAACTGGLHHRDTGSTTAPAAATLPPRPLTGLQCASYKTQDEPLDLSRPDARPAPSSAAAASQRPAHDEDQALNLSTRGPRGCSDDEDDEEEEEEDEERGGGGGGKMMIDDAAGGTSSPAGSSIASVKSECWSTDDNDTQIDAVTALANGSLHDVSSIHNISSLALSVRLQAFPSGVIAMLLCGCPNRPHYGSVCRVGRFKSV